MSQQRREQSPSQRSSDWLPLPGRVSEGLRGLRLPQAPRPAPAPLRAPPAPPPRPPAPWPARTLAPSLEQPGSLASRAPCPPGPRRPGAAAVGRGDCGCSAPGPGTDGRGEAPQHPGHRHARHGQVHHVPAGGGGHRPAPHQRRRPGQGRRPALRLGRGVRRLHHGRGQGPPRTAALHASRCVHGA